MRKSIVIAVLLAVVACKKAEVASDRMAADAASVAQPQQSAAVPAANRTTAAQRMIVRSANISMTVDDTAATIEKLTAAGESVGGYVSDSKVWRDGEQLKGSITLRIPADRLSAALTVIRKLAVRINSETLGSEEVTQEYVDLESQLRNLEATEVELRQLMTTIRQNSKKASEVLEMYQQLNGVRMQIEQIKGRMRYLSQTSAFATVSIELIPNVLLKPVVEPGGWQPVAIFKDASRALVAALQSLAAVAIWLGIYILPMMTLFAIAAFAVWKVLSRLVRREA